MKQANQVAYYGFGVYILCQLMVTSSLVVFLMKFSIVVLS